MSYDLILKHTKYNWARGAQRSAGLSATAALTAAAPKPPTLEELKLTPEEQKKLAQVKAIKAAAQRGDKRAQKMWAKAPKYIAKLKAKAVKGDKTAQRKLAIWRASRLFAPETGISGGRSMRIGHERTAKAWMGAYPTQIMGAYPTQILGHDLNDDELAIAKDGGQCEEDSLSRMRGQYPQYPQYAQQAQYQGKRNKIKHLRNIVKRSVRGDTAAQAQLQQIQSNLQTRANAGDTRATQVLNKITQWQAKYQAQYGTTAAPVTPATSYPTQPYQAPSSYYPGSSTPGDSESELDASDPEL